MAKLPPPSAATMAIAASPDSLHATWMSWLEVVPDEERKVLSELIRASDLSSVLGVAQLSKEVVAAMFEGKLSPAVALGAKPWIDMTLYALVNAGGGGEEKQSLKLVMAEMEQRRQKIVPKYTPPRQIGDGLRPGEEVTRERILLVVDDEEGDDDR